MPFRQIQINRLYPQEYQLTGKQWKMEPDSEEESFCKTSTEEYPAKCFETDGEEISFSSSKRSQENKVLEYSKTSQPSVVQKLTYVTAILKQL